MINHLITQICSQRIARFELNEERPLKAILVAPFLRRQPYSLPMAQLILAAGLAAVGAWDTAKADGDNELAEITVTATKQAEGIAKVPISVEAYSQETLDRVGARDISDIMNLTPGVTISSSDGTAFGSGAGANISIRGIVSYAGSPTTAIYIDDTPIQVRLYGYSSNAYPEIFDLERVEVLRGPQGTLFGASSEGGNIRFITPSPSLTDYSVYGRSELSYTQAGAPSEEAGVAVGGPIVANNVGFRLSVWGREDGGWLDRTNYETNLTSTNANSRNTVVIRGAIAWQINDNFIVTPTMFFQRLNSQDTSSFWPQLSDSSADKFVAGNVLAQPLQDQFALPALKIEYSLPGVSITSISSFFTRRMTTLEDDTNFDSALAGAGPYPTLPGQNGWGATLTTQNNVTEELRVQSSDPSVIFSWVAGAYYGRQRQHTVGNYADTYFPQLIESTTGETLEQLFGAGLTDGLYVDMENLRWVDSQTALFGQLTYSFTDRVKAIVGVRASKDTDTFSDWEGGAINGPTPNTAAGSETDHPVTPRFGIEDQYDSNNLYYATVAKGYRQGGGQLAVPAAACASDFANLGITSLPKSYSPDSLWSYEIGAKNKMADNRIQLFTSLFYVDWKNVQQEPLLVQCGYQYFANLGNARSMGFDAQLQAKVADDFLVDLSLG
jgi:iron complex outermembrane recepter protein